MTPREFAIEVVQKLQHANYQALWAGGCVRDQLIGRTPKDYDVATSATPEQVRDVFGQKRTLPIGASFGVITVLGPKSAGPIEVATFRRDGGYSDGRHPDSVEFTDSREDALRRDFTINGMFFDPIQNQFIDYVGGQEDLQRRQIRAIGNPHERIDEDKLRMLRGIRFASTFGFEIEQETLAAIKKHASEIGIVSGERVGAEMRRMLAGPYRATAASLLRESSLLPEILPGGSLLYDDEQVWKNSLAQLQRLDGEFVSAAAVFLKPILDRDGVDVVFKSWKLSNDESQAIDWVHQTWRTLDQAEQQRWSAIQPLLLNRNVIRGLEVAESFRIEPSMGAEFCRRKLALPADQLDPKPFLDGGDLIRLGVEPGPQFKHILETLRIAQLDGEIVSVEQAESIARELAE